MSNQNEIAGEAGVNQPGFNNPSTGLNSGGVQLSNTGLIAGDENSAFSQNNVAPVGDNLVQIQYVDENGNPITPFDEQGNPIEYVDENGNPVRLFDEQGNPIEYVDENGNPVNSDWSNSVAASTQERIAETVPMVDSQTGQPVPNQDTQTIPTFGSPEHNITQLDESPTQKITITGDGAFNAASAAPENNPTVAAAEGLNPEADLAVRRESILPTSSTPQSVPQTDYLSELDSFTSTKLPEEPTTMIVDLPNEDAAYQVSEASSFDTLAADDLENTATRRTALLNSEVATSQESPTPQWLVTDKTDSDEPATKPQVLSLEEAMLDGATVHPTVPSRIRAHLWGLIAAIILVPTTWYLLCDVSTRLRNPAMSPWMRGLGFDFGLGAELIIALISLFVVIWAARFSSLGTFFTGLIVTVLGVPFVFLPGATKDAIAPFLQALRHAAEEPHFYQAIPANLAHHIEVSGSNGLLFATGIALLALGFVSHGARRKGRKDYIIGQKVEAYIPELVSSDSDNAKLSRKERKAAKKAAKAAAKAKK